MAKKKQLPEVYIDEHIKPGIIDTFKELGFKCLLIAKTRKYAGRDEKDYIGEIYSEGRLFATSDIEFATYVDENKIKHAGIILIPSGWDDDILDIALTGLLGIVMGEIEEYGKNALRRLIFYIAEDGFRVVDEKGKNHLLLSVDRYRQDLETEYPK
jgi:hypothetical protein